MKRCIFLNVVLISGLNLIISSAARANAGTCEDEAPLSDKPVNVLMISIDDLNDWVGCLGGHPQARTPNVDRLATQGVLFTNAHCPAPSCNPCRTAVLTGVSPWRSGVYNNSVTWRDALPDVVTLPAAFRQNGYVCRGGGKFFHHFQNDVRGWDTYFPKVQFEFPEASFAPEELTYHYEPTTKNWYREFVWGPYFPQHDPQKVGDQATVNHIIGLLNEIPAEKPFFMNCGIYRPHVPWYVPKEYFDAYPLDLVQLPETLPNDRDDLPTSANKQIDRDPYYAALEKAGVHREAVQAYLASILYMDTMVGQVLDALDKSPHADNTIVVFWSDHGYHLGEKERYRKFTLWDNSTHVPMIIRIPPAMRGKWAKGEPCREAVSLQDLYPTLMELAGLKPPQELDGQSLVPQLRDPTTKSDERVVTVDDWANGYAVRDEEWTYIHRQDGEELYSRINDPHQWYNLASDPQYRTLMDEMAKSIPTQPAKIFKK